MRMVISGDVLRIESPGIFLVLGIIKKVSRPSVLLEG
jgi:hypothetical protein